MTKITTFFFEGVASVEDEENVYVGGFFYNGEYFRFVTSNGETLSMLVNDKSQESIDDAVDHLTIYKIENDVARYIVCDRGFVGELALHICRGF